MELYLIVDILLYSLWMEVISIIKKIIERVNSNGISSYLYNYHILYDLNS